MKKIWVLLMGIILMAGLSIMALADGAPDELESFELKEVRVLKALWAKDPGVRGLVNTRFNRSQCILLKVDLSLKSFQGNQIGKFLDKAGGTFELAALKNNPR